VSILPKIALLTAYYFIACLFEMLLTHKLALLLVVISSKMGWLKCWASGRATV